MVMIIVLRELFYDDGRGETGRKHTYVLLLLLLTFDLDEKRSARNDWTKMILQNTARSPTRVFVYMYTRAHVYKCHLINEKSKSMKYSDSSVKCTQTQLIEMLSRGWCMWSECPNEKYIHISYRYYIPCAVSAAARVIEILMPIIVIKSIFEILMNRPPRRRDN